MAEAQTHYKIRGQHRVRPWFHLGQGPAWQVIALGCLIFLVIGSSTVLVSVPSDGFGPLMFFAFSISYAMVTGTLVQRGVASDINDLRGLLTISDENIDELISSSSTLRRDELLLDVGLAILCATIHMSLLGGVPADLWTGSPSSSYDWLLLVQSTLLWIIMFQMGTALVNHSAMVHSLGRHHTRFLPLMPERYQPFGRAALRPGLTLCGLLAAYPLLVESADDSIEFVLQIVPGLLLTASMIIGTVWLGLAGVHTMIRRETKSLLDRHDAAAPEGWPETATDRTEVAQWLMLKNTLQQFPQWPLGAMGPLRLAGFVILPPLTWVAAAFVEASLNL